MIGVIATVSVAGDKVELFERVARELEAQVKAHEPGVLLYRMTRSRTEPNTYKNLEIFKDQAAFDAHQEADYLKAALGQLGACLAGEPHVEFLDTVD